MRLDLEVIADLITPNSQVLDVGCGDGTLLSYLKNKKNISGKGIEIDNKKVASALKKGLSIIQGDADNDLAQYPSNAADYVILSQTLQATKEPALILEELKRIAKYCIISVPNFGYWENRLYFAFKGCMPVTQTLSYKWYDTPNIHFCTIKDFISLCHQLNFVIEKQFFINETSLFCKNTKSPIIGNLLSKYGIFLLKRGTTVKSDTKKQNNIKNLALTRKSNYARNSHSNR